MAAVIMINGSLNAKVVGRSPQAIAELAGISIPTGTRVLIGEETQVGKAFPLSVEKLSPILGFYTVQDWKEGAKRCRELLDLGGLGHTLGIHAQDEAVITAFGLAQPASRIAVNTGTTFGGIGATTGIQPSLTLGCGSFGNNITSDNIGPQHLLNVKRVAFGIREMPPSQPVAATAATEAAALEAVSSLNVGLSRDEIKDIIKSVLAEMTAKA